MESVLIIEVNILGSRVSELKCNNGHYIPKLWFANNINECGDNSDEPNHLTCFSYLALTSPGKICDGIRHCLDKTDEDPKYCYCYAKDAYKCPNTDFCVPYDFICDGQTDCPGGEDEFVCAALRSHDPKFEFIPFNLLVYIFNGRMALTKRDFQVR